MKDFTNKTAVITGGASGVGKAIAMALDKEGCNIVIADIDQKNINKTLDELTTNQVSAIGVFGDVTKQDSMNNLSKQAFAKFGEVHLVFANAGIGAGEGGNLWDYNNNDWEWAFRVNTWGLIHTINAFMPKLVKQNLEANFVITGSGNGAFVMLPDQPIYTATKASVQAITETLHFQLQAQQSPVKVNALFPGPHVVNTGLFDSERVRPEDLPADPNKPNSGISSVDDMKKMMEEFGMKLQTTEPEEVAEYALEGIKQDKFWITKMSEKSITAINQRTEGILNQLTPTAPDVL